jgi:hypothetical protein
MIDQITVTKIYDSENILTIFLDNDEPNKRSWLFVFDRISTTVQKSIRLIFLGVLNYNAKSDLLFPVMMVVCTSCHNTVSWSTCLISQKEIGMPEIQMPFVKI